MRNYNQFINWLPVRKKGTKVDKVPVDTLRNPIDPHDSSQWLSYEEAEARSLLYGLKIGFVFTSDDPFFFVDVDHAIDGLEWSPLARTIVAAFPGCAGEISYSGEGIHLIGRGGVPSHTCKNTLYNLELYTSKRFVALTGLAAWGDAETDGQTGLDWLVSNFFSTSRQDTDLTWTEEPTPEWRGPQDDETLISRALRSKPFSGKARFQDLYQGNVAVLEKMYPSQNDTDLFDRSSAEAALATHLAFYTGKDCARVERLMTNSPLCQREKWRNREDYRRRTILKAASICNNVYQDPRGAVGNVSVTDLSRGGERVGAQYLEGKNQLDYFKGCCYVISKHCIFTPRFGLLRPDAFRAAYGGYEFAIAPGGKPTKNAFECFVESRMHSYPKVNGVCFRPEEPPASIVQEEGQTYVNTYVPAEIKRVKGDPNPFLTLVSKILPDSRDQRIILSYMAACVQYPGYKFQWAPLLQGLQGNGKSFLASTVSRAVGERYSHFPNATDLTGNGIKFNGWIHEKLFVVIEELRTSGQTDLIEALKPLITNSRIEIQYKGANQITGDNRANFMLFSNHKDAIAKTRDDRRYCVFYAAQQVPGDLELCGMAGSYFPNLYRWARTGGYEIVNEYLSSYGIPEEFNPAGACHRSPITTSTREAISLGVGGAEQEVLEAVEEGRLGFCGGWVSSVALDRLLAEKGRRVPLNKRRQLLANVGYTMVGRASSASLMDGGKKPTLYVLSGSELESQVPHIDVLRAYETAQDLASMAN